MTVLESVGMRLEKISFSILPYTESKRGSMVKTQSMMTISGMIEKSVLQLRLEA
jgi:hypothetical protein